MRSVLRVLLDDLRSDDLRSDGFLSEDFLSEDFDDLVVFRSDLDSELFSEDLRSDDFDDRVVLRSADFLSDLGSDDFLSVDLRGLVLRFGSFGSLAFFSPVSSILS